MKNVNLLRSTIKKQTICIRVRDIQIRYYRRIIKQIIAIGQKALDSKGWGK